LLIRAAKSEADWSAIRRICCATGENGNPIALERWPFFSENWIGPYQSYWPDWTFVAEGEDGIVGYLTGCPDTSAHIRRRRWFWSPGITARILMGRWGWTPETRRFLKRWSGMELGPERAFAPEVSERIRQEFPAHLHVNLSAPVRGRGAGQKLMEAFFEKARRHGHSRATGIHVFCGSAPVGFYRRLGFEELGRIEIRPGVEVHALGYYIR